MDTMADVKGKISVAIKNKYDENIPVEKPVEVFKSLQSDIVHSTIVQRSKRIDGRVFLPIRHIESGTKTLTQFHPVSPQ